MDDANDDVMAMGRAFDASRNDDSFYLPPEAFKNAESTVEQRARVRARYGVTY